MSGMSAVSNPPMICTEGFRISQARVTGTKVCHEANHPNTASFRRTAASSFGRFAVRPGWYQSSTS
ncbi:MAG: hypothetical protein WKF40_06805 [Thermoleophilaceae bacterium]